MKPAPGFALLSRFHQAASPTAEKLTSDSPPECILFLKVSATVPTGVGLPSDPKFCVTPSVVRLIEKASPTSNVPPMLICVICGCPVSAVTPPDMAVAVDVTPVTDAASTVTSPPTTTDNARLIGDRSLIEMAETNTSGPLAYAT